LRFEMPSYGACVGVMAQNCLPISNLCVRQMSIEAKLSGAFEELLTEGERVLRANGWPSNDHYRHPENADYLRFRTEALNLIRRACGEDSDHYRELRRIAEGNNTALNSYYYRDCFGILQAAHRDFSRGLLFELRNLVAAELFVDFLEQSEHLVENGFHVPAASLAGAVLEDGLRKLAAKAKIEIPENTKLDRLNADLARAEVYSKLVQKNITAYADIRNNADHGHFDKFTKSDVESMVAWVGRFLAEHLE